MKQLEAGRKAEDVGRELGVSKHTIYAWKAKYGGLDVRQGQQLRQLTDDESPAEEAGGGSESGQRDAEAGDLKKRVGLVSLRDEVRWLREHYVASQQRVCGLMAISVSSFRYASQRSDETLRERLVAAAREQPRWGYRRWCLSPLLL